MEPETYCQEKAAPAGSNLYYATLFHTPQQRRNLHALFALQQELSDTVAECQDPDVASIKLQWWAEEISRLYAGQARHPVCLEMQALLPELNLEQSTLLRLVSILVEEIRPAQQDSLQLMIAHNSRGQGSAWRLAVLINGYSDSQVLESVATLGGLYYCLEFFQSARRQLDRGYCPYPRNEMEKHGLNHDALLQTHSSIALGELQTELFAGIQSSLAQHLISLRGKETPSVLFALSLARIAEANCRVLQKHSTVIPVQPLSLTPLRKLWIAWRTKRQVQKP